MRNPYQALVVDDNPESAGILVASLEKGGYEVITASDGLKAIEMTIEHHPDVVLLDLKLSGRDGMDVCRTLKANEKTSSIPIVFVTGVSQADVMLKAFEVGGADYVTKPYRTAELIARVSVHAKLHRAEAALREKKKWTEERARELTEANVHLASLSRSDPLTNLLNRRAWEEAALKEHDRFERHGTTYSLLVIDVDQFKNYNDSLGHQAGDDCLRQVADAIQSTCRTLDLVGRYGGEEFVVLAPETDIEAGFRLAERIRKAIWGLDVTHPASSTAERITACTGVASAASGCWEEVLKRADDAMYVAKKAGRNMVYADYRSRRMAHDDGSTVASDLLDSAPHSAKDESSTASWKSIATGTMLQPQAPLESRPVVMIVDDNPDDRRLLRRCLEREDFIVKEAENGREALAILTERSDGDTAAPDAVVIDVMMPEVDGLECTRRLRNDPDARDIPILMVSSGDEDAQIVKGLRMGADEYLTKPVRTDEFILRVRSMTRLHRERSHLLHSYSFRGEKTRILGSLLDFASRVGSSTEWEYVLSQTLEVTAEVTSTSRVSIMLPDSAGTFLTIAKSIGLDLEIARSVSVPMGQMISGFVFDSGKSVLVNHQWEARFRRDPHDSPFFSGVPLMSAPMMAGSKTVGVLNVTDRFGRQPFDSQHTEAIDLIAGIAGAAIHRLRSRNTQEQTCDSTLQALARLAEHRSFNEGHHLERISKYCGALARELSTTDEFREDVDEAFVQHVQSAVKLHDIGTLGLPDHVLLKPGKFTEDERQIMQSHAVLGADAIRSVAESAKGSEILDMAAKIAQCHHERYDGSGYPDGLVGNTIPLSARITAFADVYDALTTSRVYRESMSPEQAMTLIAEQAGTQFDPLIVPAFLNCKEQFASIAQAFTDATPEQRSKQHS